MTGFRRFFIFLIVIVCLSPSRLNGDETGGEDDLSENDKEIVEILDILESFDILQDMDLLRNIEVIESEVSDNND